MNPKIDIPAIFRFYLGTTSIVTSRLNKIILNNCKSVGFAHWIGAYVMLTMFGGQLSDAIFHAVIKKRPSPAVHYCGGNFVSTEYEIFTLTPRESHLHLAVSAHRLLQQKMLSWG